MNVEPAYQETLDYLYSFVDYSLQRNLRNAPGKFDLARMHTFLDRLDRPQEKYRIIHVAGTKGKGSVSAMCASALQAAGHRVALYTSPHLQDYAERIQVNGSPISHADLSALVEEIKPCIASVPQLSTFEITTGLAFLYFALQKVDTAVVEVGLGGRLDATNVVNPVVSVITSLSYDHMQLLGNTLAEIAAEKAGIIKPGVPIVLAPQKDEAGQVVRRIAAERSAPLIQVGSDTQYTLLSHSLEGQTLQIWLAQDGKLADLVGEALLPDPVRLAIPLLGYHQVENAATAYTTLQLARARGVQVDEDAIQRGFAAVSWPGRFEVLQRNPTLVIDSAHNRDSALKLRLALEDYFPGAPVILIIGASEDKDIAGMFAELMPGEHTRQVEQVIATQAVHPRAVDPAHLAELAGQHGCPAKVVTPVDQALKEALCLAREESVVLVAGSLFVAAEVRTAWQSLEFERRNLS